MEPKYQINLYLSEKEKNATEKLKREQGMSHHDIYVKGLASLEKTVQKQEAKK